MKERKRKGEREGEKEGEKERIPWKLKLPWTSVCVSVAGKRQESTVHYDSRSITAGGSGKGIEENIFKPPLHDPTLHKYQGQSRPPMQVYLE